MRDINEIVINKIVLNVLDNENSNIVLANKELELTEEVYDYFEQHILKIFKSDNAHPACFRSERNFVRDCSKELFDDTDKFLLYSNKITNFLYKVTRSHEERYAGDFAICLIESQKGMYLVLLSLDFSETYTHLFQQTEDNLEVFLSKNKTGLPGLNQKLCKSAIIGEKSEFHKYDLLIIDNQEDGYFGEAFLNCERVKDSRENTKVIKDISESFTRKAFKDNAEEAERFRSKVAEILTNDSEIDINKIADTSFSDEGLKKEYKAALTSQGISENKVTIDKDWAAKKLKRKRLKVDKNIELYIDSDCYHDKDKFQIKRNGDGTIDIILKNVRNYIEK